MKPDVSVYRLFNTINEAAFELGRMACSIFNLDLDMWETQCALNPMPDGTYQLVIRNGETDSLIKVIDKVPEDLVFEKIKTGGANTTLYDFLYAVKVQEDADARLREIARAFQVLVSNKNYLTEEIVNRAFGIHYNDKRMRYLQQVLGNESK